MKYYNPRCHKTDNVFEKKKISPFSVTARFSFIFLIKGVINIELIIYTVSASQHSYASLPAVLLISAPEYPTNYLHDSICSFNTLKPSTTSFVFMGFV
jgi:hypothetical protein